MSIERVLTDGPFEIKGIDVNLVVVAGAFATVPKARAMTIITVAAAFEAAALVVEAFWARINSTLQRTLSAAGLTPAFVRAMANA